VKFSNSSKRMGDEFSLPFCDPLPQYGLLMSMALCHLNNKPTFDQCVKWGLQTSETVMLMF